MIRTLGSPRRKLTFTEQELEELAQEFAEYAADDIADLLGLDPTGSVSGEIAAEIAHAIRNAVDELRWTKPVYPGDVLSVRAEVLSTSAPRSKPDIGFVLFFLTVFNQNDEPVMTFKVTNIQRRRPA